MAVRYQIGGRVPDVSLPRTGGGPTSPVRGRPREGVVLLFPRSSPEWRDYLRAVATEARAFADWDGRAIAVTPGPDAAWATLAQELGDAVWLVDDSHGVLEPAPVAPAAPPDTPSAGGLPMAVVADRFGEIYHVWEHGNGEAGRPAPRQLEEWLQFLALQCPE
jgi:peroxiredoxin